ncbi:MAG: hypothetical protein ACKV2T_38060 [Kofleriaceae bacterium]
MKRFRIMLVVVAACGGGLGGGGGAGDECRSTANCDEELECSGPNDGPVCGVPAQEGCRSDLDCNVAGDACHAIFDPCSGDGIGSQCREPCVNDGDCGGPSFTCDVGNCVARRCDAGFACQDREECDPVRIALTAPVFDQHHGCFAVACTLDDECGERFCVNGTCQDTAGTCVEPMLVP